MQATKWALLIALVFAGISCNADRAKSEVLIKNDGGGDIPQYIAKYLYLQLSGERVVIDRDCLSACTLALGLLAQDRRCTARLSCGVHRIWYAPDKQPSRHRRFLVGLSPGNPPLD
jgi:hypothetical protein